MIKRIPSDTGREYITNPLEKFFFMSRVIYELILPYSPESNGIAEDFNQILNMIVFCITIAAPDFPCLWAAAINMAAYIQNKLLHKHLVSSITLCKRFHSK
jgi:hypothetical protein